MTFAELVKKYIPLPWASGSTLKNDVPATRSTGLPSNRATYTEGFPEITMQPVLKNSDNTLQAGSGIPPSGYDFNGVLNTVTNEIYNNKLMGLAYGDWDSTVSTTYGGYPQGAIVSYPAGAQSNKTLYVSQTDNNTSTPSSSTQWTALLQSAFFPNWSATPTQYLNQYLRVSTNQTQTFTAPYDCWFVFWATSIDWGRLTFGFLNTNGTYTNLFEQVWARDSGGSLSVNLLCKQGDVLFLKPTSYAADCRYSFVPLRS